MSDDRPSWLARHGRWLGTLGFAALLALIAWLLWAFAPDEAPPKHEKGMTRDELWDYMKR